MYADKLKGLPIMNLFYTLKFCFVFLVSSKEDTKK